MTDTFESTFRDIYDEAFDIMVERQRKYGPENVRQLGLYGVFSRLASDKIERIRRAMNGEVIHGEVVLETFADFGDESFDDALLDVANYAFIMLALRRGVWGRPLAEETRTIALEELFADLEAEGAEEAATKADLCYPQADGCHCSTIAGHPIGSAGCVHGV